MSRTQPDPAIQTPLAHEHTITDQQARETPADQTRTPDLGLGRDLATTDRVPRRRSETTQPALCQPESRATHQQADRKPTHRLAWPTPEQELTERSDGWEP